jgi:chromosome segregation ATPase
MNKRAWKRYAAAVEQECEAMADRAEAAERRVGKVLANHRTAVKRLKDRAEAAENELQVAHDNVASLQGKLGTAQAQMQEAQMKQLAAERHVRELEKDRKRLREMLKARAEREERVRRDD